MIHSIYDILDSHCNSVNDEEKKGCQIITNKNDTELSLLSNQCLPAAPSRQAPAESCLADGIKRIETYIGWLLLLEVSDIDL